MRARHVRNPYVASVQTSDRWWSRMMLPYDTLMRESSTFCARRDTLSPRQFLSSPFELRYLALRCVAFSLGRFHPRSNCQDPFSWSFWKFSWWFGLWSHRLSPLSPSNSSCLIKIFLEIFDVKFRSDIIKSQRATPTRSLEAAILTLTFSMLNYHSPPAARHVARVNSEKLWDWSREERLVTVCFLRRRVMHCLVLLLTIEEVRSPG